MKTKTATIKLKFHESNFILKKITENYIKKVLTRKGLIDPNMESPILIDITIEEKDE